MVGVRPNPWNTSKHVNKTPRCTHPVRPLKMLSHISDILTQTGHVRRKWGGQKESRIEFQWPLPVTLYRRSLVARIWFRTQCNSRSGHKAQFCNRPYRKFIFWCLGLHVLNFAERITVFNWSLQNMNWKENEKSRKCCMWIGHCMPQTRACVEKGPVFWFTPNRRKN